MKSVYLALASLSLIALSQNASAAPGAGELTNRTIRCEGMNAKGIKIGLDTEIDPVDRLVSLTAFENESVGPLELKELSAPSHFVRIDREGKLVVFGLKTFNDGLEEDLSVQFVNGVAQLSQLKLGFGSNNLAVKKISCRILK